jgi:hypothetical protein
MKPQNNTTNFGIVKKHINKTVKEIGELADGVPQNNNWEKEFNPLEFQDFDEKDGRYYTNIEKLKSFIRHQFQSLIEESEPEEIIDFGNRKTIPKDGRTYATRDYALGYNFGIKEFKENLLNKLK